jgi:hypothetical protein
MKGYVYKLWSFEGDDIYIGSTIQKLSTRLGKHKSTFNSCTSKILFQKYKNIKIECLEVVEFNDKMELKAKEGDWQRKLKCVNYQIAGHIRTPEEDRLKCKKYYDENKEQQQERCRKYMKEHDETQKEKHKLWSKQQIVCECGCRLSQGSLYIHLKSKKHLNKKEIIVTSNTNVTPSS